MGRLRIEVLGQEWLKQGNKVQGIQVIIIDNLEIKMKVLRSLFHEAPVTIPDVGR